MQQQFANIQGMAKNSEGVGAVEICCRFYLRPDQTHVGQQVRASGVHPLYCSHHHGLPPLPVIDPLPTLYILCLSICPQKHHGAREVFLSVMEHWEPFDSIWSKAYVCEPQVCVLQSTVSSKLGAL